ncbi:MAG: YggS family pyridoxal phosphate-dependent enzyme [Bacteroidales bacterium]|nr:YggS family pyridoxal phosphate-dependent enzyme [Bacteroidales bacterium]
MSDIAGNILSLKSQLPAHVTLIAVSKGRSLPEILDAHNAGQEDFGENRVQELSDKRSALPDTIRWHLIGHLQTNKVKYAAPFVFMIHSVDSLKLLRVIDGEALKNSRIIRCLLQLHIAREETKFGFSMDEVRIMMESGEIESMHNIQLNGIMGMATFTDDEAVVRGEFRYLRECFSEIRNRYQKGNPDFNVISAGMSGDYNIAIEEGSSMVRIGTGIFGERNK